jgi:hypothetical protein
MAVVETERHGRILIVRMNRPERLNALNHEMRSDSRRSGIATARSWRSPSSLEPGAVSAPAKTWWSPYRPVRGRKKRGHRGPVHSRHTGKGGDRRSQRFRDGWWFHAGGTY